MISLSCTSDLRRSPPQEGQHLFTQSGYLVPKHGQLFGSRQLRLIMLCITADEEGCECGGHVTEYGESIQCQEDTQHASLDRLRPVLRAHRGKEHHGPPQRLTVALHAAGSHFLEGVHPGRTGKHDQYRKLSLIHISEPTRLGM